MKKIRFFKDYLEETFGKPLQRIPVDLPFSCPHRLLDSGRGCTFCPEDGARARHLKYNLDIPEQIRKGIAFAQERYGSTSPYIAYFQSFTNTNADIDMIRQYYEDALSQAEFAVVIVATRPDCLPNEVLDYLSELNSRYELWVELGVQSAHDSTLDRINRGHDFACVQHAAAALAQRGIKTAAHIILGLPGETTADYRYTAQQLARLPIAGIKIHNLLVLRNTPLAKEYRKVPFPVLDEHAYAHALATVLAELPDDMIVMRLMADADSKKIIAPNWWMKKGQFLQFFNSYFSDYDPVADTPPPTPSVSTEDGSLTLYHPEFKQHFHSLAGASGEAEHKFIIPCNLESRLRQSSHVRVLDVGFGLGYNAYAAVNCADQTESGQLEIQSLELDDSSLKSSLSLFTCGSAEQQWRQLLCETQSTETAYSATQLTFGDARRSIQDLEGKFDCIFLDGFSPDKNPELWTYDFIRSLAQRLQPEGIIATYSSAFPVLGALLRCGLAVGTSRPYGRRKPGITACWGAGLVTEPLPVKDRNIACKSTAGVCYRDPGLRTPRKKIVSRRQKTVSRLRQRGVPRWFKDA